MTALAARPGTATWSDDDPRYRGYRFVRGRVRFDHRVAVALELLPTATDGPLVDVGAGDGFVAGIAAERCGATFAVAVDAGFPPPLSPESRLPPRVAADVVRLPIPGQSVATVVSLEVIEHLLDPEALLEEAVRILRPGGALVLSTPRLDSLLIVASLVGGMQPPGIDASSRTRYGSPIGEGRASGHLHLFTKRALLEMLEAHGFEVEAYREARFSSSWRQARAGRKLAASDLAAEAFFAVYDRIPWKKDVMVVRAVKR